MINHRKESPYTITYTEHGVTQRSVVYAENMMHALSKAVGLAPLKELVSVAIFK